MKINKEQITNTHDTKSKEARKNPNTYEHANIINSLASYMAIPDRKYIESILL